MQESPTLLDNAVLFVIPKRWVLWKISYFFYQVGSLAITMARYLKLTVNNEYDSRSGAEWDLEFSSLTNIIFVSPSLTKSLLTFWKEPGEENEMLDLSSLQWEYFSKRSQQSGTYLPRWWNLKLWYKIIQWKMVFGAHNEFLVHCEQVRVFFFLSLPVTWITIYKDFKQKV